MTKKDPSILTHITRIGNSRGIILPSRVIRSLALIEGDEVSLEFDNDSQVLLCSFPKTKQLTLLPLGNR